AAAAQVIGLPVLQNGFVAPGIAGAVNVGLGDEFAAYVATGAWTPGVGLARVQLSVGVGAAVPDQGSTVLTVGARVAVPVTTPWTGRPASRFGLTPFIGFGGLRVSGVTQTYVPLGVSVAWRGVIGAERVISVYASPFYGWNRASANAEPATDRGLIRLGLGLDVTLVRAFGVTVGYELGATADEGEPGATGGIVGLGVAYVF
ncbi:MAG TPA: hypothetical protein VFY16_05825, partial [Gemmatimonadaceae bacterium]|nr:hypothetical protein [Gemmatimonadaceae bacterium]